MSRKKKSANPRGSVADLVADNSSRRRTDPSTGDLLSSRPKKRKPRTDDLEALNSTEMVAVICDDPSIYRLFEDLPEWRPGDFGRPRIFPNCVFAVLECVRAVWPHKREIWRELRTPHLFQIICDGIEKHVGAAEAQRLRTAGKLPSRQTCSRFTDKAEAAGYDPRRVLRQTALEHAKATGHFDGAPFSHSKPRRPDFVYGDGTVFRCATDNRIPWAKDPVTGERRRLRVDPAAGIYREGDGTIVRGTKHVMMHTRDEGYRRQYILDVAHLPYKRPGGEAQLAVEMWEGLKQEAAGIRGVVYDGAMRGMHHQQIATRGGICVAPSIAESVEGGKRKGGKGRGKRKEKSLALGAYAGSDGCRHVLYGIAGQAHELKVTDEGTEQHIPLDQRPQFRAAPCPGDYYLYLLVTIPCRRAEGGRHEHRIPLTGPGADKLLGGRKISLMEYLRPYAPSDDENSPYGILYPVRPSAEAVHSILDRAFHFKRMPAYGAYRQTTLLVGIAMGRNAIARYLAERRRTQAPPGLPAAA